MSSAAAVAIPVERGPRSLVTDDARKANEKAQVESEASWIKTGIVFGQVMLGGAAVLCLTNSLIVGSVVALPACLAIYQLHNLSSNATAIAKSFGIDFAGADRAGSKDLRNWMLMLKSTPALLRVLTAAAAVFAGLGFAMTLFGSPVTGILLMAVTAASVSFLASQGIPYQDYFSSDKAIMEKAIKLIRKYCQSQASAKDPFDPKVYNAFNKRAMDHIARQK